jgi:hypothetical protein
MPTPRFSHIDATQRTVYAVDTVWRYYEIRWLDGVSEADARASGSLPITERFMGQDAAIPPQYLEAWTADAEDWE